MCYSFVSFFGINACREYFFIQKSFYWKTKYIVLSFFMGIACNCPIIIEGRRETK